MKMLNKLIIAVCLLAIILTVPANAQDSEAALEQILRSRAGVPNLGFYYGDYDGDGMHEAFALIGEEDEFTGGMTGDIWFVSPATCKAVQTGCSYLDAKMLGRQAPILFTAEEWYGGSGSTSYIWGVENSVPVEIDISILGELEMGEGNEFLAYPSAFDGYTDGTGHTWKPYYFFLDGRTLREYGGLAISLNNLLEFDGAREILDQTVGSDYEIKGIIYRLNGRIHVNMTEKGSGLRMNQYVTMRYEGKQILEYETGMGVYELASNPSAAVYPTQFVHPQNQPVSAGLPTLKPLQPENNPMPQMQKPAAKPAQGNQKVQTTGSVNVRSHPNLDGAKLGSVNAGEILTYLNETRTDNRGVNWYKVQYNGQTGWVSSVYSRLVGTSGTTSSKPVVSQSGNAQAGGKQVRIVGGNANIRSGPGLNYNSVGTINEGRTGNYLGKTSRDNRGVDWYNINYNGTNGWVSSKYARVF